MARKAALEVIERGAGKIGWTVGIEHFRTWNREKPKKLVDKVASERDAIERFVKDGDFLATELYGTVRAPMSLVRELCRQGRKDMRLVGTGVHDLDLLLACRRIRVRSMNVTYVGHEVYGVSPIMRRAVEQGRVAEEVVEWSNASMTWALKAASMGVPFLPCKVLAGTDTFKYGPAVTVTCPFSSEIVTLVPAVILDVVLIHVSRADRLGNCQIDGALGFAHEISRAAKRVVVSTETIVDEKKVRAWPERTVIPGYLVDAVVEAPFGSHPGEMPRAYDRDDEVYMGFLESAKTEEGTEAFMKKYVYGVSGHDAYLDLVGRDRLERLRLKDDE